MNKAKPIRFTKEGYEQLKAEHAALLSSRPAAVENLKKARELGDLSENGWYKAARMKLSFIDGRLRHFSTSLKQAVVIDNSRQFGVGVGSIVVLSDNKTQLTYHIVGDLESDPGHGKISLLSPMGKAIAGKLVGEDVVIHAPVGSITYRIVKIS